MEFFRKHKLVLKLILIPVLICFLTVSVFLTVNKPIKTHAEVFTAIALGTGALVALVASYFAAAGVQVTNNGGSETYVEGFFNDIIDQYKQSEAEHQEFLDTYFNDQGQFIGSEEDLQFIIGENANGYWNLGKGMTSLMEDIKSWFVDTFNVSSSPIVLSSFSSLNGYTFVPSGTTFNTYFAFDSVCPCEVGEYSFQLTEDYIFNFNITSFGGNSYNGIVNYSYEYGINDHISGSGSFSESLSRVPDRDINNVIFAFTTAINNGHACITLGQQHYDGSSYYLRNVVITNLVFENGLLSEMSLDGVLTDGYTDFQDAIFNDFSNQFENEDAVFQVGVGSMEGVLTGEDVTEKLLEQATTNTLEGTYEGVYENQDEATSDKVEFVPTYPNGWVPITGLQNFFPFCIPWDIYAVLGMLQADPEAPVIEWEFSFGKYADPYKVTLDFNRYNTLATVLRASLFVLFLIGLILKTRNLIKG